MEPGEVRLCKNCAYYRAAHVMCASPNNGVSLIDGKPDWKLAVHNRAWNNLCGKDGNWFAYKLSGAVDAGLLPEKQPWWKFWK